MVIFIGLIVLLLVVGRFFYTGFIPLDSKRDRREDEGAQDHTNPDKADQYPTKPD